MKEASFAAFVLLLLLGTVTTAQIPRAEASNTIYIRSDGSIHGTDRINSTDNVTYAFIANINDPIVVERDNVVIDGVGLLLCGPANWYSVGVDLSQRFNVTIKNLEIASFGFGVKLNSSSNVTLVGNRISSEYLGRGVVLQDSSGNNITGNWFETNRESLQVYGKSAYNIISGNNITRSYYGIVMLSSDNTMFENNITCSDCGLYAYNSNRISIMGNNITHNRNESEHGAWGLHIMNCNSSYISRNNFTDNQIAFEMHDSYGNLISGNNMSRNSGTTHFDGADHVFSGNNFENNSHNGLLVSGATNSRVVGNNFDGNADAAIYLMGSFIVVADNNITNTKESFGRAYAIDGYGVSDGCVICRNNISGNGDSVALQRFFNAVFSDNYLADNGGPGLYVLVASNCTVSGNHIANSVDCGIETRGCNNSLFTENEIQNNSVGVSLQRSYYNGLYRNSFVNNTQQVYTADSANYWDDGYSSGGNYWSDGAADDKYQGSNQTVVGSDGICDLEYSLDANNTDHYPLMGKYLKFNTTSEDHIETICNSTISDFKYNGTAILFNVSSMTGTTGFCRICIPENLLGDSFEVYVNGTKTEAEILSCSNTTHKYIYFVYTHSKEEVIIIPELHQLLLLQIFAIAVPVVIFRQKRRSS